MSPLIKRILIEQRGLVWPLAVALLANILAYAFVVYPLGLKSAGAANRAVVAVSARQAAEREEALSRALVTGKSQADEELNVFYQRVLPVDQTAARRMTYASLPALARRTDVRYEERRVAVVKEREEKDSRLGHLEIRMVLEGEYQHLRDFIYQLERSPEFVIIDDVTLLEAQEGEALTLTIEMSTYYHQVPDGI